MAEITASEIKTFLQKIQGKKISLQELRIEFNIVSGTKSFDSVRNIMFQLAEQKVVKALDRGIYKVVTQVKPVKVFAAGRERRPPFELFFPKDFNTGMEMGFAEHIVIREGDIVTIGGVSNYGKTCLALHFCGENIDYNPILMGNEYTTRIGDTDEFEPTPRLLNRLDNMDWVQWTNGTGEDRFELMPVREDYAEHIEKDRINIIDWINLDGGKLYEISKVMDGIKAELGRGIGLLVLQKGEGDMMRGGQFSKDFVDCELLIDKFTETESMLTIGKVKEYTKPVIGKKYAFAISEGVKIINFREIVKCSQCWGHGVIRGKECDKCYGQKYTDR